MALNILKTFCGSTTIHGLTYIVQTSRHWIEKVFWSLSLLISFILTGLLIRKLIVESQNNPTVIYTSKETVNIKDVTFPAFTVCLGLIYRSQCNTIIDYDLIIAELENNKQVIVNLTGDELKLMQVLSLASHDHFMSQNFPSLKIPTDDFMEQLEIFNKMIPPKFVDEDTIYHLMKSLWLNKYLLNTVQVLSDSGSCYTFNMPPIEEIYEPETVFYNFSVNRIHKFQQMAFVEIFYAEFLNSSYPQKARSRDEGLTVELDLAPMKCLDPNGKKKIFEFVEGSILDPIKEGFYVQVHSPYEVPSKRNIKFNLNMNEQSELAVTPKITTIDESLVSSSIKIRNCYLHSEKKLKFFKVYNKINCEHECLTEMTQKSCGCVQFFMARNRTTQVCGTSDEKCFREVEDNFDMFKSVCKCLDPCESVTYEVELRNRGRNYEKESLQRLSKMTAKVTSAADSVFVLSKKKSQTAVEFLSFVGGLLGLFAGFSFMAIAEILYYFIILPITEKLKSNDSKVYPFVEDEALESSSIHTFSYIGNDKKSLIERLAWTILFTFSMVLASYSIQDAFATYKNSLITFNYESSPTKVEEIPFPAFTIVRDLELNVYEMFEDNITDLEDNENYQDTVYWQFELVACIRFGYLGELPITEFQSNTDLVAALNYFTFFQHPWFKSRNASWNRFIDPPFAEVLTSTLKGYTFNLVEQSKLLNEDIISEDFYYSYGEGIDPNYPWKTSAGENMGFDLEVNMSHFYVVYKHETCQDRNTIIIHQPNELPIGIEQITISQNSMYEILITPRIVKSDEDLKSLDLSIRKCYFEDERKLKFFKIYTQRNCELECYSHVFTDHCGCTPYNQIRNKTANLCDFRRSKSCYAKFQNYFNASAHDDLFVSHGICNCLPTCNFIEYSYEIDRVGDALNWLENDESTVFGMRWKDSEYFAMVRSQQLKFFDFLAYVGGILGLFAGISVLSIIEILYFMTLRLATDLIRACRI